MALRIASETDPAAIARRGAEEKHRTAIRQLAANLLRVIRGAGRPLTIVDEVEAVALAAAAYDDAFGYLPGSEHNQWLAAPLPGVSPEHDFEHAWRQGENRIISGA